MWPPIEIAARQGSSGCCESHVQDGPFADTKELLGGFLIIAVPELNAALTWAARGPAAGPGSLEIRQVLPPPA